MNTQEASIGRRYLAETRYRRADLGRPGGTYPQAPRYKEYPQAAQRLGLKPQAKPEPADLWRCLARRRSERRYRERPLSREELAHLLWAAQGITAVAGSFLLRAAPSAGALYPVETYLAVHRVEGVDPGIWHFQVPGAALALIQAGDYRRELVEAGLGQDFLGSAAVVFIWTAVLNRAMWKYRERAIRYLFLDAGHICQNLMLAATALGLGVCPVGAFFDDEVEALLKVDGVEETALYLAAVGPLAKE
jgi:SagB-type dehydrogenase family enzyme